MNIKKIKKLVKNPSQFFMDSKIVKKIHNTTKVISSRPTLGIIIIGSHSILKEDTILSIDLAKKSYSKTLFPYTVIEHTGADSVINDIKDAAIKINTDYIKIIHEGELLHVDFFKSYLESRNWDINNDIISHSYTHDISTCQLDPLIGNLKTASSTNGVDTKEYLLPLSSVLIFKTEILHRLEKFYFSSNIGSKICNTLNIIASSSADSPPPFIRGAFTSNTNSERLEAQLQNTIKSNDDFITILEGIESLLLTKNRTEYIDKSIFCLIHNIVLLLLKNKKADELLSNVTKLIIKDKLINIINGLGVTTLKNYSANNYNHVHKIGYLKILGINAERDLCYVEDVNTYNHRLKFKIASHHDILPRLFLDGKEIIPLSIKIKELTIFNLQFSYEIYFWLPYQSESHELHIKNAYKTELMISGKRQHKSSIKNILNSHFKKNAVSKELPRKAKLLRYAASLHQVKHKLNDAWLFIDNEIRADDNAEHFYRYVSKNHPNINCFFLISKNSSDWERLNNEGFKLIKFGSLMHRLALLNAKYLLSSHANPAIVNYLPRKHYSDIMRYKFVFLQHGITKDDQSEWLNSRKIDFLVTAAQHEFNDISGHGRYRYTAQETVLTGFPRFDNLIATGINNKQILIMPTWRKSLSGELLKKSSKRIKNPEFVNSYFCKMWGEFLRSEQLKKFATDYGYKIKFLPHPNIADYLEDLAIPSYIEIGSLTNTSIQTTFIETDILITDFSSVAFDLAYINKPIIYFQFDSETFFSEHSYSKGYYDYEKLGFGPVVNNIADLNSEIGKLVSNNCTITPYYQKRIKEFFPYQDQNNSSRLFNVLNSVNKQNYSIDTIIEYIAMYTENLDYKSAVNLLLRFDNILTNKVDWHHDKLSVILNNLTFIATLYDDEIARHSVINMSEMMNIQLHNIAHNLNTSIEKHNNVFLAVKNYAPSILEKYSGNIDLTSIIKKTEIEKLYHFIHYYNEGNYELALQYYENNSKNDTSILPVKIEYMRCLALIKTGNINPTISLLKRLNLSNLEKDMLLENYYHYHSACDRHNLDIYSLLPNIDSSQLAIEAFLLLSNKIELNLFNYLKDKNYISNIFNISLKYHIDALLKSKEYSKIFSILDNSRNLDIYLNNDECKVNYLTIVFETYGIENFLCSLEQLNSATSLTNSIDSYFINSKKIDFDIFYRIIESIILNDLYPFTCREIYKYALFLFNNNRPGLAKKLVTLSMMKKHEAYYTDKNNWDGDDDYKTLLSAISELNNAMQEFNRIA